MDSIKIGRNIEELKRALSRDNSEAIRRYRTWLITEISEATLTQDLEHLKIIRAHICTLPSWSKRYQGTDEPWRSFRDMLLVTIDSRRPYAQSKLLDVRNLSGKIIYTLLERPGLTTKELSEILDIDTETIEGETKILNRESLADGVYRSNQEKPQWFLSITAIDSIKSLVGTVPNIEQWKKITCL